MQRQVGEDETRRATTALSLGFPNSTARSAPWALHCISLNPTAASCAALCHLTTVAAEKHRRLSCKEDYSCNCSHKGSIDAEVDRDVEVLLSRFADWPLPALTRCASLLHALRGVVSGWMDAAAKKNFSLPSETTTSPRIHYRRLYNICLWQRRHPLFILTPLLDAFGGTLSCEAINDMLESLSHHLAGTLCHIPHLLRCDVLMTYNKLSFSQQLKLMEMFRTGYTTVECEASQRPPQPELYIGKYMSDVPPRFGLHDLSESLYTELRGAFERHKQAGVRRLLSCTP